MNRAQKVAWFNLTVTGTTLILSAIAVGILAAIVGMPGALGGLGTLGLSGALGLSPLIFRKKKGQAKVTFDERDALIWRKAVLAGFVASYLFFVCVCMITWFIVGFDGSVPVNMLPMMIYGGLFALMLVQSIVILIQYGRGEEKNHE